MLNSQETAISSETVSRIGGNRRPQTFRDCLQCGKRFGPLENLKRKCCSKLCAYAYRTGRSNAKRGTVYPHLWTLKECRECKISFHVKRAKKELFCSVECYGKFWKREVRPRIDTSKSGRKGALNQSWKGDRAGYAAMHKWIARLLGKPNKCEYCKRTDQKKYEWANIDHEYRRNAEDYIRLCTKCHRRYDMEKLTGEQAIKL
jgi:hypothetical protein